MVDGTVAAGTGRPIPIGRALETARKRVRFSEEAAARALHITERELSNFEAGIRTPSKNILDQMARIYGVEPHRFGVRAHVPRVPPRFDPTNRILWIGWISIKVPDPYENETFVRRLADALRTMRSLSEAQPVYLRENEQHIIGRLLDLEDHDLPRMFMSCFGLSYSEAVDTVTLLRQATADEAVAPKPMPLVGVSSF